VGERISQASSEGSGKKEHSREGGVKGWGRSTGLCWEKTKGSERESVRVPLPKAYIRKKKTDQRVFRVPNTKRGQSISSVESLKKVDHWLGEIVATLCGGWFGGLGFGGGGVCRIDFWGGDRKA